MRKSREPLVPDRVRRPPAEGFSWVDRRFVRDYALRLSRDAILLYFFLAAVSDKSGLSFYSDERTAAILRLKQDAIAQVRGELLWLDLVAWRPPLTQVLSLPSPERQRVREGEPRHIGEILRGLFERRP